MKRFIVALIATMMVLFIAGIVFYPEDMSKGIVPLTMKLLPLSSAIALLLIALWHHADGNSNTAAALVVAAVVILLATKFIWPLL